MFGLGRKKHDLGTGIDADAGTNASINTGTGTGINPDSSDTNSNSPGGRNPELPPGVDIIHKAPKATHSVTERLDPGENIIMALRQGRLTGVRPITPAAIFATLQRVIIRRPTRLGFGEDIEEYRYDTITNIRLERGIISSKIRLDFPGASQTHKDRNSYYERGAIGGLDRADAEHLYRYIRYRINCVKTGRVGTNAKSRHQTAHTPDPADPLTLLQIRFVSGEITIDEFQRLRKQAGL